MKRWVVMCWGLTAIACQGEVARSVSGGEADTVRMNVAWEVAPRSHPSADSLGDVSGVAMDALGNVYVSDFMAAKVWVFDAEGTLRLGLGNRGQGPGEFEHPTGAAIGPNGRLYVRDEDRVTVFGPDPATGLSIRLEDTFVGPIYPDWTSKRATRFDSTGALLYPGARWLEDGTATNFVLRFGSDRSWSDTVLGPRYANTPQLTAHYRTGPGGGRMLEGLNHAPFAAVPVWDATRRSTIVSGDGSSYTLFETDYTGVVLDTIRRDVALDPIPPNERRDSVRALRSRLDSVPVPLDDVLGMPQSVRDADVPHVYPAYLAVYSSAEGELWVRRWIPEGESRSVFDLFTAAGEFDKTVVLPRAIQVEPTPYLSRSVVVGVTTDPTTDEHIVIRFSWPDS